MEKLETLNTIALELNIKSATLQVFRLHELYDEGKKYSALIEPPCHLETGILPQIVFEDRDQSFCSIFSDPSSLNDSSCTKASDFEQSLKLVSEGEILSSDFEVEQQATILTSDASKEPLLPQNL